MKRIFEINDADVGDEVKQTQYRPRTAARAILEHNGKIALLHVTKHDATDYYKLPGGGVDEGESIQQALHREILEETGCKVEVLSEVGEIVEHKSHKGIVQTSHCFRAKVIEKGEPEFTDEEVKHGFELAWVTKDEAIRLLKESKPIINVAKFIVKRDLMFLEK